MSSLSAPLRPTHGDEPPALVTPGADGVAATLVLATKPAPVLSFVEQRLLARFVENVDRRLLRTAAGSTRDEVMDRLCRLVAVAGDVPVGDGIALLATTAEGVLLHLRAPVRDRVVVRDAPTEVDLGIRGWPGDPMALVLVSESRVRLLTLRHGMLREAADLPFPVRRDPSHFLPDHLARVDAHLVEVIDPDLPIVVGGSEGLATALRDRSSLGDRIVGVLPGDQSQASPATLVTLARRLPTTLSSSQRRALAELAVARLHGRVVAGADAVRAALPGEPDPFVVVEAAMLDGDDLASDDGALAEEVLLASMSGHGRIAIVPTGRLHPYGGIALVTDRQVAS